MGSVDVDVVMPKPRSSKSDGGRVGEGSRSEMGREAGQAAAQHLHDAGGSAPVRHGAGGGSWGERIRRLTHTGRRLAPGVKGGDGELAGGRTQEGIGRRER
jgi:hypothetical protein